MSNQNEPRYIVIKHSANPGDLIYCLAAAKKAAANQKIKKKVIIYQRLGRLGDYYQGATHPTRDANGKMVCMNQRMFDMLKPLIMMQDYVEDFKVWKGEPVDVDFDKIREQHVGAPHYNIAKWVFMVFPNLTCDLSAPWLQTEPTYTHVPDIPEEAESQWKKSGGLFVKSPSLKGKIIVNLTERYRNPNITYYFLKQYENKVVFAGTEGEYELFKNEWELNVPRLHVDNFLDLAKAIKEAAFLVANQSLCYAIAESLKTPRILEVCSWAPNVDSVGGDTGDFMAQQGLEDFVQEFASKYL